MEGNCDSDILEDIVKKYKTRNEELERLLEGMCSKIEFLEAVVPAVNMYKVFNILEANPGLDFRTIIANQITAPPSNVQRPTASDLSDADSDESSLDLSKLSSPSDIIETSLINRLQKLVEEEQTYKKCIQELILAENVDTDSTSQIDSNLNEINNLDVPLSKSLKSFKQGQKLDFKELSEALNEALGNVQGCGNCALKLDPNLKNTVITLRNILELYGSGDSFNAGKIFNIENQVHEMNIVDEIDEKLDENEEVISNKSKTTEEGEGKEKYDEEEKEVFEKSINLDEAKKSIEENISVDENVEKSFERNISIDENDINIENAEKLVEKSPSNDENIETLSEKIINVDDTEESIDKNPSIGEITEVPSEKILNVDDTKELIDKIPSIGEIIEVPSEKIINTDTDTSKKFDEESVDDFEDALDHISSKASEEINTASNESDKDTLKLPSKENVTPEDDEIGGDTAESIPEIKSVSKLIENVELLPKETSVKSVHEESIAPVKEVIKSVEYVTLLPREPSVKSIQKKSITSFKEVIQSFEVTEEIQPALKSTSKKSIKSVEYVTLLPKEPSVKSIQKESLKEEIQSFKSAEEIPALTKSIPKIESISLLPKQASVRSIQKKSSASIKEEIQSFKSAEGISKQASVRSTPSAERRSLIPKISKESLRSPSKRSIKSPITEIRRKSISSSNLVLKTPSKISVKEKLPSVIVETITSEEIEPDEESASFASIVEEEIKEIPGSDTDIELNEEKFDETAVYIPPEDVKIDVFESAEVTQEVTEVIETSVVFEETQIDEEQDTRMESSIDTSGKEEQEDSIAEKVPDVVQEGSVGSSYYCLCGNASDLRKAPESVKESDYSLSKSDYSVELDSKNSSDIIIEIVLQDSSSSSFNM